MTMSNLHPGLILLAVGILALLSPKALRRYIIGLGPLAVLPVFFSCSWEVML